MFLLLILLYKKILQCGFMETRNFVCFLLPESFSVEIKVEACFFDKPAVFSIFEHEEQQQKKKPQKGLTDKFKYKTEALITKPSRKSHQCGSRNFELSW